MFSFFSKEAKMGLRLSKDGLNEFIQEFDTKLLAQHSRAMKEYVEVPDKVLCDTKLMSTYMRKSFDYVSSLNPKS